MPKLILHVEDSITMEDALKGVQKVLNDGKISTYSGKPWYKLSNTFDNDLIITVDIPRYGSNTTIFRAVREIKLNSRRAKIKRLHAKGYTNYKISDVLDLSYSEVCRNTAQMELTPNGTNCSFSQVTSGRRDEEIKEYVKQGKSNYFMLKALHCGAQTLQDRLKVLGLK